MFGRRTKTPEAPATATQTVERSGKGRPTPTRKEAERLRKARVKPPTDRREAYRRSRAEARASRERRRTALLSGDERYLPARDQGPVRAYVRDVIDSRRSVAEFFLLLALFVLVASIIGPAAGLETVVGAAFYLWTIALVLIVVDSTMLRFRLRKGMRERFPDESHKGAVAYGIMRSTQMRRLRLPKPRVKPGQRV